MNTFLVCHKGNKECIELLEACKKGDRTKQKILYEYLKSEAKSVMYSYYSLSKNCGLVIQDLENLASNAFMHVIAKYDSKLGELVKYYRYIYANLIKDEIRKSLAATKRMERQALCRDGDFFDTEETEPNMLHIDESKERICNYELTEVVLDKNFAYLNKTEKIVLKLYLYDYTFEEISKIMKLKYSLTLNTFHRLTKKMKIYVKDYLHDIYEKYSYKKGHKK